MSAWLIGIVTIIYAGVAASEWVAGNKGMSLTFLGYSFANIGLIMQVWK